MKKLIIIVVLFVIYSSGNAEKISYRVVVKFGSMCCGVPSNKPLVDYMNAFKNKHKIKKITCDNISPRGKEGEYDMCFFLKELKKKQIDIFVKEVIAIAATMKEQGYASVEENLEVNKSELGRAKISTVIY